MLPPSPTPFDHPDADLILRSSDKEPVDFRVFKLLLSLASPFFNLIFTLPQPSTIYTEEEEEFEDGIPVIQMAEDSHTLQILLEFCYPLSIQPNPPRFATLQDLSTVTKAAFKFEMTGILQHVRRELTSERFIESQPLRVFSIASHHAWEAETRLAARYTLRHPVLAAPFIPELRHISAAAYHHLQAYHHTCGEVAAARALLQPAMADFDDSWVWIVCQKCPGSGYPPKMGWLRQPSFPEARSWWGEWIEDLAHELRTRPWGGVVKNYDIMSRALKKAAKCMICRGRAREDLDIFMQMLSVDIEKEIDSVKLSLDFDDWD